MQTRLRHRLGFRRPLPRRHVAVPRHTASGPCDSRQFESLPLVCRNCDADLRIVAFITEATVVQRTLSIIGKPA
jgi:hypothetical protein